MRRIVGQFIGKDKRVEPRKDRLFPISKMIDFYGWDGLSSDVLFFGDSVAERISRNDKDTRTLNRITADYLNGQLKLGSIIRSAYHAGVYYLLIQTLRIFDRKPATVVLPINMRSFSPQWDLNPEFQCVEDIRIIKRYLKKHNIHIDGPLYDIDKKTSRNKFLKTEVRYPGTSFTHIRQFVDIIESKPNTEQERGFRLKQIFTYHYIYPLRDDNRKLELLKALISLVENLNIKLVAYITPINYKGGLKYAGEEFINTLKSNINRICGVFGIKEQPLKDTPYALKEGDIIFRDCSMLLGSEFFFNEDNATEHLNEKGRSIIAKYIADACLTILRKKAQ